MCDPSFELRQRLGLASGAFGKQDEDVAAVERLKASG